MNTKFYFALMCVALFIPSSSQAFVPLNPTAHSIDGAVGVFTIGYGYVSNKTPIYLPVFGSRTPTATEFGYRVRMNDEPGQAAASFGFVVSDAPIENGMYVIKPGTQHLFTAVMIVVPFADESIDEYHVNINQMPFFLGEDRQSVPLNKHQLKTYVTPSVAL